MLYNTTKNNDCLVYLLIFEQKIKTYFIMKTQEIAKQNELIVRFLDWNEGEDSTPECLFFEAFNEPTDQRTLDEMLFNKSWDWLMPVIDQIKCVGVDEYTLIDNIDDVLICIELQKTFEAVIEFIEWYNEQN